MENINKITEFLNEMNITSTSNQTCSGEVEDCEAKSGTLHLSQKICDITSTINNELENIKKELQEPNITPEESMGNPSGVGECQLRVIPQQKPSSMRQAKKTDLAPMPTQPDGEMTGTTSTQASDPQSQVRGINAVEDNINEPEVKRVEPVRPEIETGNNEQRQPHTQDGLDSDVDAEYYNVLQGLKEIFHPTLTESKFYRTLPRHEWWNDELDWLELITECLERDYLASNGDEVTRKSYISMNEYYQKKIKFYKTERCKKILLDFLK